MTSNMIGLLRAFDNVEMTKYASESDAKLAAEAAHLMFNTILMKTAFSNVFSGNPAGNGANVTPPRSDVSTPDAPKTPEDAQKTTPVDQAITPPVIGTQSVK